MPKSDGLKRMDDAPVRYIRPASPEGGASIGGTGNATTLGGFYPTRVPAPNSIPVTDVNGLLSPFIDPDNAMNGSQAAAWTGMRYIAPSARLMAAIGTGDTQIVVSAPLFTGDESAILSHYSVANEKIWIMGAGDTDGKYWRYPIQRAKGGTAAQVFPAGTEVINLGSVETGGFIYASSAYDGNSPHIAMRQNNDDASRSSTWKMQLGRLSNVPDSFKALFPNFDNWDRTFGGAAENFFASGGIHARYGEISGSLSVTGQFYVNDTLSNARMEVGFTPSGWGQVFRDTFGQPVWQVVMPWPDKDGNRPSDIVWTVNSFGERAIYFRREGDEWVLSLGGFDVREDSMTSGDFGIYPEEQKVQFAYGKYISWSEAYGLNITSDLTTFTTTDNWVKFVNIEVGTPSQGPDEPATGSISNFGHTSLYTLSVDSTAAFYARPSFQYTTSQTAGAENGALAIIVNGQTKILKLYDPA